MEAKEIIDELIQSHYDKNNILCIGKSGWNIYAVIIPTPEQLICKDRLAPTKHINVYSVQDIVDWYHPKADRELWCLQYFDLVSSLLSTLDNLSHINISYDIVEIRNFLLTLFSRHYQGISIADAIQEPEQIMDKNIFLKQLTHAEMDALNYVFNEVGADGNVSVSKMVEKYTLSRPVWTNLFKKIQEFQVGEIVSQGVKGTHITITHPQLRYDAEHRKI